MSHTRTHKEAYLRRKQIADAVKHGMTVEDACDEYQVSYHLVTSSCREWGVDYPKKSVGRPSNVVLRIIAARQNTGLSQAEIAREVGVSPSLVSGALKAAKKAGVSMPGEPKGVK